MAARLGVSRSELYARALAAFLRKHEGEAIVQTINRVVRASPPRSDRVLTAIQLASLGPDEDGFEDWVAPKRSRPRGARPRRTRESRCGPAKLPSRT
jgi:hypothetical protein